MKISQPSPLQVQVTTYVYLNYFTFSRSVFGKRRWLENASPFAFHLRRDDRLLWIGSHCILGWDSRCLLMHFAKCLSQNSSSTPTRLKAIIPSLLKVINETGVDATCFRIASES